MKTAVTWPCTLRLYLKDKPVGKWEEKTNIASGPMRFFFFFTSALTSRLYASCGSNHSPSAEKQASSVRKVSMMKTMVWTAGPGPKAGSSIYFQ